MIDEATVRAAGVLGAAAIARLRESEIAIVGVGGVGSWCAEALVRTGARRLILVDDDVVVESNLNRQAEATATSVGRVKVDAMRDRLLAIAPDARIEARRERQRGLTGLENAAVIVDAIDSVDCKAALMSECAAAGKHLVSSMGAALRRDPTKIRVMRFDKVTGDGLARALRARMRKNGTFRQKGLGKIRCVCSEEPPMATEPGMRGSLMTVTAVFGMALANEVIEILTKANNSES